MESEKLVNKFNAAFPVGSKVYWRGFSLHGEPYQIVTVKNAATVMTSGHAVAWFEGRSGCCSIEEGFVLYDIRPVSEAENSADGQFLDRVREELENARAKFPSSEASGHALQEEAGELAKALMYEPWPNVYAEAVQVAAMALRVAVEGDATMNDFRQRNAAERGHG